MRIVFAGTPEFAVPSLRAAARHNEVVAVYTQPDRPAGRGRGVQASPVKLEAVQRGIPVLQPENFKSPLSKDALIALQPDVMVVVAYGLLLPRSVLAIPQYGCWNVHASLLPRWRGAAPIQRAILAGDRQSGVALMQMEAGLDTGPVLLERRTPIAEDETGGSLHDRLAQLGPQAVLQAIDGLAAGTLKGEVQDDALANYAHKLNKDEARLDFSRPAVELERLVRAFHPWPICHTTLNGDALKVHTAELGEGSGAPGSILAADKQGLTVACGEGALRLTRLQLPGGKPLAFSDLYNSRREQFAPGLVLGQ